MKVKNKTPTVLLFAFLIIVAACSTHQGIKPIEPKVGHYSATVVANLTPTFRWEALSDSTVRYDFAIFEVLDGGQASESVYYREGLAEAEHTIETKLKPGTNYYWSVRSRRGTTVSPWATYDHTVFIPIPFGVYYSGKNNLLFRFKTPDV